MKTILVTLAGIFFFLSGSAQITVAKLFTDHVVLQRSQPVPVWGTAASNEKVTVRMNNQLKTAKADNSGKWAVLLDPQPAGGPYEMTVYDKDSVVVRDILIGEVWLCSGQSNMEFPLKNAMNADTEMKQASYPEIRQFKVARDQAASPKEEITKGSWSVCTPESAGDFTAVGYFFAREIQKRLKVPVGLINSTWGGTMIECWISRGAFEKSNEFKSMIATLPKISPDSLSPQNPDEYPTTLFNAMINPLIPYGIRGVLWYQGEANASRAYQYRQALPLLISDWRQRWGIGNFPFYLVQLASFEADHGDSEHGSTWAELREAQTRTLNVPNTGIAITTDIGESHDIHPKNKQDVGRRLAAIALNNLYGQTMQYSGPVFESFRTDSNKILLSFTHTGSGLMARDKYGYLKGFEIAGGDHHFHYAKAYLRDNQVVVYSDIVPDPQEVRYAWADDPSDANLYNQEGFPAIPFRTDQWKGLTDDVRYEIGK
jgi:sialate O-acetylesterase